MASYLSTISSKNYFFYILRLSFSFLPTLYKKCFLNTESLEKYHPPIFLPFSHWPGTHNCARLVGQRVLRIHLFPPLQCWDHKCESPYPGFLMWVLWKESAHCAHKERPLLTELSSQHKPRFSKLVKPQKLVG